MIAKASRQNETLGWETALYIETIIIPSNTKMHGRKKAENRFRQALSVKTWRGEKFAVMTLLFSLTHSKAIMKKWYYTLKTLQVCKDSILYIPLKHRAQVIDYFNRERPTVRVLLRECRRFTSDPRSFRISY